MLKDSRGITLIELLIILAIISILALIAVPVYRGIIARAQAAAYDLQVRSIHQAAELYILDGGADTTWRAAAGDTPWPGSEEPRDGWGLYLEDGVWPENPLGTGDFVVRIEGGRITITPGRGK